MSLIEAKGLRKVFRQAVKEPGLRGAVKHLFTQRYVDKHAVDGIDLTIREGETVAYVGPNGAGKSTTIKMLSGVLVPTSGELRVDGFVPHKQRMENAVRIGAVFGQRTQLWWDIPVRESLNLLKDIYQVPEDAFRRNLDAFVELLGMEEFIHLSARKLSLGQRMRADLAAALLHDPKIVYLDEPTIGLDVSVKQKIRSFIKQMNRDKGTTLLLTTHDLGDIEDLCERLVIIDHGRIIYDGSLQAVKDAFARERTIHLQLGSELAEPSLLFSDLPEVGMDRTGPYRLAIRFDRFRITASEIVKRIISQADVADFHIDEPNIESIIRRVYEGSLDLELAAESPVAASREA
ncbi:ABC transporter ATP-binding protein [Cohnella thailandensis]|uniref:ATP-binding cassette domain-containing protein n=1 Tax=Cohnella thailandensis TaxID=557557 RepID=A0A841SK51_9BACL|nr:ATP-binding cassette domain-containing protein [Cohnella thailandensis]MBB6632903.1 ATP-binding cassette domain-containing protein [Cohnella thailandensis]MBP1975404.1 ABC-2 type transport system ATP-binding protein [Cohnella thailandensis]